MADPQQLDLLRQGAGGWNEWRTENLVLILDLREADLSRAHLSGADLSRAQLSRADISRAHLRGASLREADLSRANLYEAHLSRADLYEANLRDARLRRAILRVADLSGADLSEADLSEADLSETKLLRARIHTANLSGANLSGANLSGARLSGASLHLANLSGANLSGAILTATVFGNTNLTSALGLEACVHHGPSILDFSTLTQSGRLPLSFLRGCGLPDILIQYLPSLLNEAIQFFSCFISYSTSDQEFADRLYADLQNKGVRCWFAPHDIKGGKKIHEQIDEAIRFYERLLLILSPASMDSEWVKTEIAKARKREMEEKRRMLFPVRLVEFDALRHWECFDSDTGKDSAREIREYYVPDFTNWKDHDSYQKEFQRLLRDLKSDEK